MLAKIRNFHSLKNISDMVLIPVNCLEQRHLIDYDNSTDMIRNMIPSKAIEFMSRVEKFKTLFNELYQTIIELITNEENR